LGRPPNWFRPEGADALTNVLPSVRRQVISADLLSRLLVTGTPSSIRLFKVSGTRSKPATVGAALKPPATAIFERQLGDVESKALLRNARAAEIMAQLKFNPAFWANVLPLNPRTTPNTLELMLVAEAFASHVCQRVKLIFNLPRPHEMSPRIQPIIATPGWSTYPSGHATASYLVAELLEKLVMDGMPANAAKRKKLEAWVNNAKLRKMLADLAERIADNRVVAGIHFPIDNKGGKDLATLLTSYLTGRSKEAATADSAYAWLWNRAADEWKG
jgi:membrane-associated phospholipid phosphatase